MLTKLTYANVMATLALFVALGGSSYAAITITGKNVKNGSLTTSDIRNRSLLSRDFKSGQLPAGQTGDQGVQGLRGPQGAAGRDATKLFAYIRDGINPNMNDADVEYGSGVTGVSDPSGDGAYTVSFNRSLAHCVVQAIPGSGNPTGNTASAGDAVASVAMMTGHDNQVQVDFQRGNPSKDVDTAFLITAFC